MNAICLSTDQITLPVLGLDVAKKSVKPISQQTDELDAAIVADFIFAHQPAAWPPPLKEVAQLQGLGASP